MDRTRNRIGNRTCLFTGALLGALTGALTLLGTTGALACPPHSCGDDRPAPVISLTMMPPAPEPQRAVDLALCLDTSGSMEGLIDAARQKLWEIVNEMASAKPLPKLRVALLTFGNDGHNAENGWVSIDVPFTTDLDLVSQKLFALRTNGGTELVGRVLKAAGEKLDWTASDDALKLIIVAGNESADQDDQFSFRDVCRANIGRGIMINSIYCGDIGDNLAPAWKDVSTLADGHFAAIDHNHGTIIISTPYDQDLITLSTSLNETYIAYGAQGEVYRVNQTVQDANAASMGTAVAAQRAGCKGNAIYTCSQWDLVDACKDVNFKLESVKDDELPEPMRGMTIEQKRRHVAEMAQKRGEIQAKVADLNKQRQAFVEAELKKSAADNTRSFDAAIRKAIRAQAAGKGFSFEEPAAEAPQKESVSLKDGC